MIKIRTRYNLLYPLMLFVFSFLREVDSIFISRLKFNDSLLLTFLMFLAEFIAGLLIFSYNLSFFKERKKSTYKKIKLIQAKEEMKRPDSRLKIYFLIFMAAYFDFIEFIITTIYISKYYSDASKTLYIRQRCILTLVTAFFCFYLLKIKIFRHQIFSLLAILVCLIMIIILEYIFEEIPENKYDLTVLLFFIFIDYFFNSFIENIDKYLLEYNYANPFQILMFEGLFGLLFTILYSIKENPLVQLLNYDKDKMIYLVICLFLFFLFSCGRNSYRIVTNKLYSPMTRTLTDSFLDPFLILYYFISGEDFKMEGITKYIYFSLNFILLIIIIIFGSIYNEVIVLFCCQMEHDTHSEITIRASKDINFELPLTEKSYTDNDSNYYD